MEEWWPLLDFPIIQVLLVLVTMSSTGAANLLHWFQEDFDGDPVIHLLGALLLGNDFWLLHSLIACTWALTSALAMQTTAWISVSLGFSWLLFKKKIAICEAKHNLVLHRRSSPAPNSQPLAFCVTFVARLSIPAASSLDCQNRDLLKMGPFFTWGVMRNFVKNLSEI